MRAYLRPIPIPPSISSATVSLEQIALSPSQIQQSHCGCDWIATLWNLDGDVVPFSYSTSGIDWSNTGHITSFTSPPMHLDPVTIPYNPAETRFACLTNDKYLLETIVGNGARDAMIWTASGTPHNTVDMNYLSNQITVIDLLSKPSPFSRTCSQPSFNDYLHLEDLLRLISSKSCVMMFLTNCNSIERLSITQVM